MKFIRKKELVTLKDQEIFKSNGEFNLTIDLAHLLDTILTVCAVNKETTINGINLELKRCGFFVSYPELKKIIDRLIHDGMIANSSITDFTAINSN